MRFLHGLLAHFFVALNNFSNLFFWRSSALSGCLLEQTESKATRMSRGSTFFWPLKLRKLPLEKSYIPLKLYLNMKFWNFFHPIRVGRWTLCLFVGPYHQGQSHGWNLWPSCHLHRLFPHPLLSVWAANTTLLSLRSGSTLPLCSRRCAVVSWCELAWMQVRFAATEVVQSVLILLMQSWPFLQSNKVPPLK